MKGASAKFWNNMKRIRGDADDPYFDPDNPPMPQKPDKGVVAYIKGENPGDKHLIVGFVKKQKVGDVTRYLAFARGENIHTGTRKLATEKLQKFFGRPIVHCPGLYESFSNWVDDNTPSDESRP